MGRLQCENWGAPATWQLYFCSLQSLYLVPLLNQGISSLSQSCISCAATFAVEKLGSNGQINKNSLKEQFLLLAVTTAPKVAPVRWGRLLRWLPRQAKPLLRCCWHRTLNKSHWPWNVKIVDCRKARSSIAQQKAGMRWENCCPPTTSQLHFCALHNLYLEPLLDQGSSSLSQSCSCAAASAVDIWAEMGQITSTACKASFGTLLLRLQ